MPPVRSLRSGRALPFPLRSRLNARHADAACAVSASGEAAPARLRADRLLRPMRSRWRRRVPPVARAAWPRRGSTREVVPPCTRRGQRELARAPLRPRRRAPRSGGRAGRHGRQRRRKRAHGRRARMGAASLRSCAQRGPRLHTVPASRRSSASSTSSSGRDTSRVSAGAVVMVNCPFHALVEGHRDLVCRMNHAWLSGVTEEAGLPPGSARLDPAPRRCCVTIATPPQDHEAAVIEARCTCASDLRPRAQRKGFSRPRSSGGRGPKIRRSDSSMRTSLMLASRRRISPCSSNSHSSLP